MSSKHDIDVREHKKLTDEIGERRVRSQPINEGASLAKSLSSIGSSATEVKHGSNRLTDRRGVYIKNTSTVVLLWGFASDACVFPLSKETAAGDGTGGDIWIDVGDQQPVYIKAASGSSNTAAIGELK
uniref:Uncharacterized protein n=1 Tax=Eiseniibacteriota bacterium TaxID=2212470 RepID=A0A832I8X7_UNCEI